MKLILKDFQEEVVDRLVTQLRRASAEASETLQVAMLTSPTGSGKTVIMTAAIEQLLEGNTQHPPDKKATFLWITDQPELNEQTRQKMLKVSSRLGPAELRVIDSSFDAETLKPGQIYFLNTQKLGKDKLLISRGDKRDFTIWQTVRNTVRERGPHLYVIIDEAHRGMGLTAAAQREANTIVQKFILGSPGEIPPIPIIIGITATPERFKTLLSANGAKRIQRPVDVPPEDVRTSGLLKEMIHLVHPSEKQPSDITMLRAAATRWIEYRRRWEEYCTAANIPVVSPILIVQVEDGTDKSLTRTDLPGALAAIRDEVGHLPDSAFAHAFQEGTSLSVASRSVRYLAPSQIDDDPEVQVVFFKTALNTGWDCPRAETMMSFRTAKDATHIAQLVGRMVRTPLARRITADEALNTVALFLPHYEQAHLEAVVEWLTSAPPDEMPPTDVSVNEEFVTLALRHGLAEAKAALEVIPSYVIPRRGTTSQVRRVLKLARLLAKDGLEGDDPVAEATQQLLDVLRTALDARSDDPVFAALIEEKSTITARVRSWSYGGELGDEATLEFDVSKENLDDLLQQADNRIGGQGVALAFWGSRAEEDSHLTDRGKLEAYALTSVPDVVQEVEQKAKDLIGRWLGKHRAAIKALPESSATAYNEVHGLAVDPELEARFYPDYTTWRRGESERSLHLYADEAGSFPARLNSWEAKILEEELSRNEELVAWLRNEPNKAWSVCVPYSLGGQWKGLYPDLLFVRKVGDGFVVDLIDPHSPSFSDAPAKARGLANYAAKHAPDFGRIELAVVASSGEIHRLNLVDEDVRRRVQSVSTTAHLEELYDK